MERRGTPPSFDVRRWALPTREVIVVWALTPEARYGYRLLQQASYAEPVPARRADLAALFAAAGHVDAPWAGYA